MLDRKNEDVAIVDKEQYKNFVSDKTAINRFRKTNLNENISYKI